MSRDQLQMTSVFQFKLSFQVTVPYINGSKSQPTLDIAGYHFKLAKQVLSGSLVSFFGNFVGGETSSSQITTVSNSMTVTGGPSYSNRTGTANATVITFTTFASGNASSALGAAQGSDTTTSTSSEGSANSTAVATANAAGVVTINTNATVANASDAQSIQNQRAGAAATSCAADNTGASASAEEITTVTLQTGQGETVTSVAYAACQAGLQPLASGQDSGSSSLGSTTTISGVSATITCDGVTTTNTESETIFHVVIDGTYCKKARFSGAITGQRTAETEAEC